MPDLELFDVDEEEAYAASAAPLVPPEPHLETLRSAAARCRACHLWRHATQTVFGEGSATGRVLRVGEQPGDREDLAGRPAAVSRSEEGSSPSPANLPLPLALPGRTPANQILGVTWMAPPVPLQHHGSGHASRAWVRCGSLRRTRRISGSFLRKEVTRVKMKGYIIATMSALIMLATARPTSAACCAIIEPGLACSETKPDRVDVSPITRIGLTDANHRVTNCKLYIDNLPEDENGILLDVDPAGQWDCPHGGAVENFERFERWLNLRSAYPEGAHFMKTVSTLSTGGTCTTPVVQWNLNCP